MGTKSVYARRTINRKDHYCIRAGMVRNSAEIINSYNLTLA